MVKKLASNLLKDLKLENMTYKDSSMLREETVYGSEIENQVDRCNTDFNKNKKAPLLLSDKNIAHPAILSPTHIFDRLSSTFFN